MIVQPLNDETIQGFDLAIFSAGARPPASGRRASSTPAPSSSTTRPSGAATPRSRSWWPRSTRKRSTATSGLIANPNCSTMQLMVALKPIYDAAGIERLIVSTYQSVSGTGVKAVDELEAQTHARAARPGAARAHDLPAPDRVQRARRRRQLRRRRRPHRRRAQDDVRDAEDPRRRVDPRSTSPARACRCINCHSESVTVQTREPLERRRARASCSAPCPGLTWSTTRTTRPR